MPSGHASSRSVLSIGNFDGVHVGHSALLRRARQVADAESPRARVVVLAFHPHPAAILAPDRAPSLLTTFERRSELLLAAGADEVVRLDPGSGLLALAPEAFIDRLVSEHRPIAIVEGPDFRFGKGRAGDNDTIRCLGAARGFESIVVPAQEVALVDQTVVAASSSTTRWLLDQARVRDAAIVLGRPHSLEGVVVQGHRRGRLLMMPTANLETPCLPPGDGVFAGWGRLDSGERWPAAISVGTNPTFNDRRRSVEAHLVGWRGPGSGGPEYGWRLRLELVAWLRDQARFASVEPLLEQMRADVRRTLELCPALEHARLGATA